MTSLLDLPGKPFISTLENWEEGFKSEEISKESVDLFRGKIENQLKKLDEIMSSFLSKDNKGMSMWAVHMDSCLRHLERLRGAEHLPNVGLLPLHRHSMAVLQTTVEQAKVLLLNEGIDWE